jgi:hypothetical protein
MRPTNKPLLIKKDVHSSKFLLANFLFLIYIESEF